MFRATWPALSASQTAGGGDAGGDERLLKPTDPLVATPWATAVRRPPARPGHAAPRARSQGRHSRLQRPDKKAQSRKVFFSTDTSKSAIDIFEIYRTRFQIEFLYRDAKQYTGLCNCQSRNSGTLDFAFNMSLSTINIARQFGTQYSTTLSVGDVKVLLHNAAMVERLFSMFGNSPNLKINNTDFKELLFYGVRAAA